MIRATTLILASLSLPACSWLTGLEDPELRLRAEYHGLELRGRTRMQSVGTSGIENNAPLSVDSVGGGDRDDEYGGTLIYGDGFAGFELSYLNVEMDDTDRGTLGDDYGVLGVGDVVTSKFQMDEIKLTYIAQLFEYETEQEVLLRFGIGGTYAHRDARFTLQNDATLVPQQTKFRDDGGIPAIAGRVRADYNDATIGFDYAYSDWDFGGDLDGRIQDYAVTATYTLEDQGITFRAGHRWLEIPASGTSDFFRFDHDFKLEGFVLGVEFAF